MFTALVEVAVLEHRQALVVVHRQHRIEAGAACCGRNAVSAGSGPTRSHAVVAQAFAAPGSMMSHFLVAQMAVLARMRVQAEHGDARRGDAEVVAQRRDRTMRSVRVEAVGGDRVGHRAQRQVGGRPGRRAAMRLASIITTSQPACAASSSVVPV